MTPSGGLSRGFKQWRKALGWWIRTTFASQRARWQEPRLFNAAYRRPASQSSTRADQERFGAQRGTDGRVGSRGYFATKRDNRPWWMVKLKADWPIHSIRIHNRRRSRSEVGHLQVSISPNGQHWTVVHSAHHQFGDMASPGPLVIRLLEAHGGRFVKLELTHRGVLVFNQVEVMVAQRHKVLQRVSRRYRFDFGRMTSLRMVEHAKPFSVQNVPDKFDGRVEAFYINATQGRFGNHVKQIGTAVALAEHLGVPRVYLTKLGMLEIDRPIKFGTVTVLPDTELKRDRPTGVLCGTFYFKQPLGRAFHGMNYRHIARAARAVGQPLFHRLAPAPAFIPEATDLAIHFRAGDIFSRRSPHPSYPQPPLAFYRLCVDFARVHLGTRRVILVYEDEGNPCVGAVKCWLDEIGFPYVSQSRTLEEDLAVLLAAQHCVFGRGTFGLAIAILSRNMRTVFHSWLEGNFRALPEVADIRAIMVEDAANGYIRLGDWRNTPEQRRMMLDYPIGSLRLTAD
jgi:F5/8 type C domain